jgi:hypothetical protein
MLRRLQPFLSASGGAEGEWGGQRCEGSSHRGSGGPAEPTHSCLQTPRLFSAVLESNTCSYWSRPSGDAPSQDATDPSTFWDCAAGTTSSGGSGNRCSHCASDAQRGVNAISSAATKLPSTGGSAKAMPSNGRRGSRYARCVLNTARKGPADSRVVRIRVRRAGIVLDTPSSITPVDRSSLSSGQSGTATFRGAGIGIMRSVIARAITCSCWSNARSLLCGKSVGGDWIEAMSCSSNRRIRTRTKTDMSPNMPK